MKHSRYRSIETENTIDRRNLLRLGALGAGVILGNPDLWVQAQETAKPQPPAKPKTNIDDALKIPRTKTSLPGAFPGKVVHVQNDKAMANDRPNPQVVEQMFTSGLQN